jgi:hypothetical protein
MSNYIKKNRLKEGVMKRYGVFFVFVVGLFLLFQGIKSHQSLAGTDVEATYGGDPQNATTANDTHAITAVVQSDGNGFVAAGSFRSGPGAGADAWVMKVNGAGSIIWQFTYGNPIGFSDETAKAIVASYDAAGNRDGYVIAGVSARLI